MMTKQSADNILAGKLPVGGPLFFPRRVLATAATTSRQAFWGIVAALWWAMPGMSLPAATTNTFTFSDTTVTATTGLVLPANGATVIEGTNLTAGEVVLFDGIVSDLPGSTSDAWGAVEFNAGGGYLGVINSTLGVLVETGTSSGNPCQVWTNGSSTSTTFGISQGSRTNRVQIQLTCTHAGSTTNMSYVVKVDQGATGVFTGALTGTGLNFAKNAIALTFGANNKAHEFIATQPIIGLSAPASVTVAAGANATFAVTITQGFPLNTTQQWLSNGVPVLGATNLSYTTPAATAAGNGAQYSIVVTNVLTPGHVVTSAPATLSVRTIPGLVPFVFSATATGNTNEVYPLTPPSAIAGTMLLMGDTVVFDGIITPNGALTGSGDGWVGIDLAPGGYEGVTGAQLGVLARLGTGASQLYANGTGPLPANPASSGALTNHVHIELYPAVTGSTTNMGWLVEFDQNLTGRFLPAVTGTNLTFPGNIIPVGFSAYSVAATVSPVPTGLLALNQHIFATNCVVGNFDDVTVTGNYMNVSNTVIAANAPGLFYFSNNTNVVTVSATGFVQAVGAGQVVITSTYSNLSASTAVSVVDPGALMGITLVVSNQMPLYSTQQINVLGTFANVAGVNLLYWGQPAFSLNNTNIVRISPSGLMTAIAPGSAAITAMNNGLSSAPKQVIVSFPTNPFVFDTFGDGFWAIVNQGNSNTLVVSSSGASQATATNTTDDQQFEILYNLQNSTFRIRNRSSWQCLGAKPGNLAGTGVIPANYSGLASQQWYLVDAGNGGFRIVNSQFDEVLQSDNGTPASVTLANASASPFQYWNLVYQTHYPKKGAAGYEGDFAQLGLDWAYNYDDNTGVSLPAQVDFVPMIHDGVWEPMSDVQARAPGWRAEAEPDYLLTYNEPDNASQANMSTNEVIVLWPQLQALNLPLVSPATQNTLSAWENNFFGMIAAASYRVDYSAVHEYVPPSASSLIGDCRAVYNTYGRPVWLTEFSPVDWNNTKSWSENDDYNFLAEFMWQAESEDWLKRYAIFPFTGTNTASPWVDNGYSGTFFLDNNGTLSPYGELYATWDADMGLEARTPYLLHNLATSFRLTGLNCNSTPQASSIYIRNASTEWGLLPASATNRWYIISLNDGRRLRDSGGSLNLAPHNTTGSAVEWEFNGPDGSGYNFITNTSSDCLNSSGSDPAVTFNTMSAATQNNNTRWRLVKAYQPVSVLTAVPQGVTFNFTSQAVSLNWLPDSNLFYNLYRGTTNGGPYSLVTRLATTNFVDTTASLNGVPYYYMVTGLNAFGDESGDSAQAAATVAAVWRQQWFGTTANAGNAADTADPAGDGIINFLKRAFNLDPLVAESSGTPYGSVSGNTFTLTYRQNLAAADLVFQAQASLDLIDWTTNNITDIVVSSDGSTAIHAASVAIAGNAQFLRVLASSTQ